MSTKTFCSIRPQYTVVWIVNYETDILFWQRTKIPMFENKSINLGCMSLKLKSIKNLILNISSIIYHNLKNFFLRIFQHPFCHGSNIFQMMRWYKPFNYKKFYECLFCSVSANISMALVSANLHGRFQIMRDWMSLRKHVWEMGMMIWTILFIKLFFFLY